MGAFVTTGLYRIVRQPIYLGDIILVLGLAIGLRSVWGIIGTLLLLIPPGIIGRKKFQYDVWGDTVNTASRMESHGLPGKIQVTKDTYDLLESEFVLESRGKIDVKGKGEMETWFLVSNRE